MGLRMAYSAYVESLVGKPAPPAIKGLTDIQRFYYSFAALYRGNRCLEDHVQDFQADSLFIRQYRPSETSWLYAGHKSYGLRLP
jgi:predicted metalloendopeptidase